MVDSAYITESCLPSGESNGHCKTPAALAVVSRSPLSSKLRVVLPQAPSNVLLPSFLALTHLTQQLLHIAVTQSDDSQRLGDLAACIGKAFNVDGCAIALPDASQTTAQVTCWFADASPLPLQPCKTAPDLFADCLTAGVSQLDPVAMAGIEPDKAETMGLYAAPANVSPCLQLWQSIALLRTPLLQAKAALSRTTQLQGRVNGVINLMRSRPHVWTQAELEGLQTVSHQVATIIEHLRLQEQHRQQRDYQQVVNQLTLAIHNASNLSDILKLATEGTAQALQMQRGLLLRLKHWDTLFRDRTPLLPKIRVTVACEWLHDGTTGDYVPSSLPATPPHEVEPHVAQSFWLTECTLCQQGFGQPDRPIILADEPLIAPDSVADVFHLESLPTLLLAPLKSQGTILGFLVFQHEHDRVWQPETLELVQLVSAQVSTAIIQTETLRQVQSLVEKRTAELRESLALQAKLYDRTRYQLDQLQRLNQVKDEFLSTVSHELRTPLTSMTMAIRMLRQVGVSDDRSTRYLDILEQQCAQETNLINDLLGLQELESNQIAMHLQAIDLKALIQDLARLFHQKWATKGLTLEAKLPRRSLRLLSDRDSLHRILFELLTNAGKYADPNTCVHLHVALQTESATPQIVVTLRNTGQGIAPDELPLIFDKFKRCQGATQKAIQGTGLGLALVKSLVLNLNGNISAASHVIDQVPTYETCFTLTLPQTLDHS